MAEMAGAIVLVLGVIVLFWGRKFFWLFVAAVGFVAGLMIGPTLFTGDREWMGLVIALVAGILGAVLAIVIQKIMIGLAGFLVGGYLLTLLAEQFVQNLGNQAWIPFIIGGVLGVIIVAVVFDMALIILSSFCGAAMIVLALDRLIQLPAGQLSGSQPIVIVALGVVLFLVGFIVQLRQWSKR